MRRKRGSWLRYPLLVAVLAAVIFPFYWMVATSVAKESTMYASNPPLFPSVFDFSGWTALFHTGDVGRWLANTLVVAGGATILTVVVAMLGAYGLSRFAFRGRVLFGVALLASQMLPDTLIIAPIYVLFRGVHLLDTLLALVLIDAAFNIPIGVWILKGFLDTIAVEIEEAALIDGCGRLQTLWLILLPNAWPAVIAVGIITFFETWNEYLFAVTLTTSQSHWVTSVGLASFIGQFTAPIPEVMAGAIVFTAPMLFFYFFLQRYFVSGLTSGAVKG